MADLNRLIKAVKDHSGLTDEELKQAGQHGADAGWAGFTYYSDTEEFYDNNEQLIWELLEEMADDSGVSINELIASFRSKYSDLATFKNNLAWMALEIAGQHIEEMEDSE